MFRQLNNWFTFYEYMTNHLLSKHKKVFKMKKKLEKKVTSKETKNEQRLFMSPALLDTTFFSLLWNFFPLPFLSIEFFFALISRCRMGMPGLRSRKKVILMMTIIVYAINLKRITVFSSAEQVSFCLCLVNWSVENTAWCTPLRSFLWCIDLTTGKSAGKTRFFFAFFVGQ